jgi:hypothetical protein
LDPNRQAKVLPGVHQEEELSQNINAIREAGVTKEMAQAWADFYREVAAANPATATGGNPNALARSQLMQAIADLL